MRRIKTERLPERDLFSNEMITEQQREELEKAIQRDAKKWEEYQKRCKEVE